MGDAARRAARSKIWSSIKQSDGAKVRHNCGERSQTRVLSGMSRESSIHTDNLGFAPKQIVCI